MTLNDKDIKKILKLSDRTGSCPDKNVFIAVLMNELSEKDQAAFFDHVLRCKECGEEFALMKRVFFETKDTLDDLSRLDLSGGELQRVKDYARQQIRLHKGGRGIRFLSAFRSSFLIPLAAGILVVIAVAVWRPWKSVHSPDVYRIGDTQTMVLLAPSEVSFSEDSVFRWNRLTGAGYYIFELLDKELTPVWKSDVLKSPRFHLLLEIAQKLTVEETYFWKITAFTDEGLKMNSGIKSFKFKGMKRDVQEIPAF